MIDWWTRRLKLENLNCWNYRLKNYLGIWLENWKPKIKKMKQKLENWTNKKQIWIHQIKLIFKTFEKLNSNWFEIKLTDCFKLRVNWNELRTMCYRLRNLIDWLREWINIFTRLSVILNLINYKTLVHLEKFIWLSSILKTFLLNNKITKNQPEFETIKIKKKSCVKDWAETGWIREPWKRIIWHHNSNAPPN